MTLNVDEFNRVINSLNQLESAAMQARQLARTIQCIVGREFIMSGRDAPTLLDLIEEPFDQIAIAVQIT